MKQIQTSAVLFVLTLGGCTKRDVQVKTETEHYLEEYKKQVEAERARDAYQNSPAYKEKLKKALGTYNGSTRDIKVP